VGSGSDGSGSNMMPVHPAHAEVREKERELHEQVTGVVLTKMFFTGGQERELMLI